MPEANGTVHMLPEQFMPPVAIEVALADQQGLDALEGAARTRDLAGRAVDDPDVSGREILDQPVAEPSRAELMAYFEENRDRYASGETITFDHVYFAFGSESGECGVIDIAG